MDIWTKVEMLPRIVLANKGHKILEAGRYYVATRFLSEDTDDSWWLVMSTLSAKTAHDNYDLMADDCMATRVVMFYGETMVHAADKVGWGFWKEHERGEGRIAPQIVLKLAQAYAEAFA